MGVARFRSGLGCSAGDRADHHLQQRGHGQTSKPMSNGTCMHIKSRLIVAVGKKKSTPDKTAPGRLDHLGSVSRLEPTDRRVIDVVA